MLKKIIIFTGVIIVLLGILLVLKPAILTSVIHKYPFLNRSAKTLFARFNHSAAAGKSNLATQSVEFTIQVDASQAIGQIEPFYNSIGMSTFHDGLIQAHNYAFFKAVGDYNKKQRLMKYVNTKSIFMDPPDRGRSDYGAHVCQTDETGRITYYWGIVDKVLDRLLENRLTPIISLSFMPEVLASDPDHVNPWNRGIISPPKDYKKWQELIYQTILHLKQRFGKDEICQWYFEVWNEPDLYRFFWHAHPDKKRYAHRGDFDEYCKLYDYTVAGAIAAESQIKIGGPAIAGDEVFGEKFLEHCFKGKNYATGETGTRLDFLSRHHYGEIEERIIPRYVEFINYIKKYSGNKFNDLEILITETGPSTDPQPWLNDRYVAAWIAKEFDAFLTIAQRHGPEYLPDIICFWCKPVPPNFTDQFGLVTALGNKFEPNPEALLNRPAFGCYEAINLLGHTQVAFRGTGFSDLVHGFAFKNDNNSVDILIYHYVEGDVFNNQKSRNNIHFEIIGLQQAEYALAHYMIDESFSNGFNAWKKIGSPEFPTTEQLQYLKKKDDLELIRPIQKIRPTGGSFKIDFTLQNNSISFIRFMNSDDKTAPLQPGKLAAIYDENQKSVKLEWPIPAAASDGDLPAAFEISRNGAIIARTFENFYTDSLVTDDSCYEYAVKSIDDAGNNSEQATVTSLSVPRDTSEPKVVYIKTRNSEEVVLGFSEPLLKESAENIQNYLIEGIEIKNAKYKPATHTVTLSSSSLSKKQKYRLQIFNVQDLAKTANSGSGQEIEFQYILEYIDRFEKNTVDSYEWLYLEGPQNECRKDYDLKNQWLLVAVGDDHRFRFAHELPEARIGTFRIRFKPLVQYPSGGAVAIFLKENDKSYFKISNTDGYGPGKIEKYVNEKLVAEDSFATEYNQGEWYSIEAGFTPTGLTVLAFNDHLAIQYPASPIQVNRFEIELTQQDAIFDDIEFSGE